MSWKINKQKSFVDAWAADHDALKELDEVQEKLLPEINDQLSKKSLLIKAGSVSIIKRGC